MPTFLAPVDFTQNEARNLVIQNLGTAPSSPIEGQVYQDTNTGHHTYIYNGSSWVQLDGTGITQLTGDVTAGPGSGSQAATVVQVGGASAANVADAVTKRHTQNTDTGTTSATFQLNSGSSGVKLKDEGSNLASIRNAADSSYGDLKVNNLYVIGNLDEVSGSQINNADVSVLMQSGLTTNAAMVDGGFFIKRLDTDNTTRIDAKLAWDESADAWYAVQPNGSGTMTTRRIAREYNVTIGDNSTTSFTITHNLGTKAVAVSVYAAATPYAEVLPDVKHTTTDTLTIDFTVAPTTNQYVVTVIG